MSTCPLHNYPIKDDRGCWRCLDILRTEGKLEEKESKPKKLYQIPKVSKSQAKLNRAMTATRREIIEERGRFCEGCGRPEGGEVVLEDSHVVSRDYCRDYGRMDLYTDKRNRKRHCRTWLGYHGCHEKWHSNAERHTLLDYKENMKFIKTEIPRLCAVLLMNEERALKMRTAS